MMQQAVAAEAAGQVVEAPQSRRRQQLLRLVPWLLALFFTLWSLRGLEAGNVVNTDAARHAMNGAFVYDLVRHGEFLRPIEYGKEYYGRLPALSLPYHPPLFPAIEAVFFALFGVKLWAARLAVALAVGVSVLLLYKLVVHLLGSHLVAACSVVTFCFWRIAQAMGGDVMLEYPSLAFALGALWQLRDIASGLRARRALAFALLGAAAVWTKQQTVFVGAVPFFWIFLARRWSLLRNPWLWAAAAVFAGAVVALSLLSLPFQGTGVDQVPPAYEWREIMAHNLRFYLRVFTHTVGLAGAWLVPLCIVASLFVKRRPAGEKGSAKLLAAWLCAAVLLLLVIGPYEARYLFHVYVALAPIFYDALRRIAEAVIGGRLPAATAAAVASIAVFPGLQAPPVFLYGPAQAAAAVIGATPRRVVYCGSTDGNFIFAARSRDAQLRSVVISAEKLPPSTVSAAGMEAFATRYGIHYVIVERSTHPQACDALEAAPAPSMVLEKRIPLTASSPRWQGHLSIYRLKEPAAAAPQDRLRLPVPKIGSEVNVSF